MMRIKMAVLLALCLIAVMGCGGCWNEVEPKELAIIHSVIYDITDDGKIKLTAEIMNPFGQGETAGGGAGGGGGGETGANIVIVSEGDSAREALAHQAIHIEQHVFGGHNMVRFFTEEFAEAHIIPTLDYMLRDHLTDETPLMIVIKGEIPEDIHFSTIGLSDMVGDYFEHLSVRQPRNTSKAVFTTTLEFVQDFLIEGKQPVTGVAEIVPHEATQAQNGGNGGGEGGEGGQEGDEGGQEGDGEKIVQYDGLAAFKEGELVGFMDGIEARAYNILTNNLNNSIFSVPSGDGQTVFKISSSSANIKASVSSGEIAFNISVKMVLNILGEGGKKDVREQAWLDLMELEFNQAMQQEISAAVKKAQQEFRSDIFGFGRHMHRQLPDKWKQLKENWDDRFADAAVYVTVKSMVTRTGQTKEPLKRRKEDE